MVYLISAQKLLQIILYQNCQLVFLQLCDMDRLKLILQLVTFPFLPNFFYFNGGPLVKKLVFIPMRFPTPVWEILDPLLLITICIFPPYIIFVWFFFNTQKKQASVYCSFWVSLSNIYMYKVISKVDNQWIHLVLSFIGSEERFQVFKDGALVPRQQTKAYFSRPLGDGLFSGDDTQARMIFTAQ